MATEKIRVLKIDHQDVTSKKSGQVRKMRVLHCWIEQSYQGPDGELVDGSFVAKTSLFDEKIQIEAGTEYLVDYRLGEGYGVDAGRLVPRIVSWTPANRPKPVGKAGAGVTAPV
ncbi:hypothetical protein QYH69_32550 [Paraburkholderia sp. SARCC-3016]|uniref:hypothetical protein n=1 Tax=Paraburkholderia sp. SARCC-3016 TaxID=3058611 RepID=UPI00280A1423|nr:hypothetical protein [Paraburkholderia sp. SARCC-3016]MDQ7981956.1 hypothetical protein [Paraburkholderia sp. SARCC-3016]